MGMTTHENPYDAATTWVVSVNTWLVICMICFGFLVARAFLLYFILGTAPNLHWWTDSDDLDVIW